MNTERISAESTEWNITAWCLRWVIAVQCLGTAARILFAEFEVETAIYGILFFNWNWPEATAQQVEDVGTWIYLACGSAVLIFPLLLVVFRYATVGHVPTLPSVLWQTPLLLVVATWQACLSVADMYHGGVYADWMLGEHAVRIAAPIAMLMWLNRIGRDDVSRNRAVDAIGLLRAAAALTFITHGIKALELHGPFIDLVIGTDANTIRSGVSQADAQRALTVIGVVDIVAGLMLLFVRWRVIAMHMAVWGIVTAASRVTSTGWMAWPELCMRAANGGVPLAIGLFWWNVIRSEFRSSEENHHEVGKEESASHNRDD